MDENKEEILESQEMNGATVVKTDTGAKDRTKQMSKMWCYRYFFKFKNWQIKM